MNFVKKHKKRSIFLFVLAIAMIIYAIPSRGVIRVIFQPHQRGIPLCVMTIHPDGRVVARAGRGFVAFGVLPVFTGATERREAIITQDDYEFLFYVIHRNERPNLRRDTNNPRNSNTTPIGWFFRVSTMTRRYTFFSSGNHLPRYNIIHEFTDMLYEINPFDLYGKFWGDTGTHRCSH